MALPGLFESLAVPVIGAPMFILSNPDRVIARRIAGIVGAFPALNARPAGQLGRWLSEIAAALDADNQNHPDRPASEYGAAKARLESK